MTNTITNLTANTTGATTMNNVSPMSESAKASAMSQVLFSKGLEPKQALALAAAFMNKEYMIGKDMWEANMEVAMEEAIVFNESVGYIDNWFEVLLSADLITEDGEAGEYLIQLNEVKDKSYPIPKNSRESRKRYMMPSEKASPLMVRAIDILQDTEYTVDEYMLQVATSVFHDLTKCDEGYVITGCMELLKKGNVPVTSEFFADRRGRLYQGDCHGPNGQSSDMARSFMDLSGVPTDYDIDKAMKVIMAEMSDMTDDVAGMAKLRKEVGDIEFIKSGKCGKPWSFVKAARIMRELMMGNRPYIGMAFGLDAKCSGPQLGALMVGDKSIAEACGFISEKIADAYQLAIQALGKYGNMFTRSLIKKPYMGIFYGQAAMAFADETNYGNSPKQHAPELLPILKSMDCPILDFHGKIAIENGLCPQLVANAFYFHSCIEESFGEMSKLRRMIRDAHAYKDDEGNIVMLTDKPTKHTMPDGLVIAMKYMERVDINNAPVDHGHVCPDVEVQVGLTKFKFNQMSFKTKVPALQNFARTGFVNMIQGTDALLARHIIVELGKLDAQHVIAVHDCFRVNIHDMIDGKLHEAIKSAYMNIFCNTHSDIVGEYFKGVQKAGSNTRGWSQIVTTRRGAKLNRVDLCGLKLKPLILDLENSLDGTGNTYFFAK